MEDNGLLIRPMTDKDLDQVVRIHVEAFPGYRSTRLGRPFLRKMYLWYVNSFPFLAFSATLDQSIVGFVVGAMGPKHQRFTFTFWHIIWGLLCHPWLLFDREMFLSWRSHLRWGIFRRRKRIPQKKDPALELFIRASLDSIAIAQRVRGKGVGSSLVGAFESAARKAHATHVVLGVKSDNRQARHLYEKCGWRLTRDEPATNSANYLKQL